MSTSLSNLVGKIAKLRTRTVDRGASEAEAETSARILGRLLMEHPELEISIGTKAQPRFKAAGSSEWLIVEGFEVLRQSDKAILFAHEGRQTWIPKSVIHFEHSYLPAGSVCLKRWFAQKELGIFQGAA